ncbi:hypothetical protein [Paraburkholderia silvatlantica]|uniref:hypothetical protein n=1 Tax=Paraburkholderia silvatlantica TaxID=321895 RepID=UPI00105F530A|nr:hypothetical protein [Paraburkholderia silvatlantica]TDQ75493.1 hypothetical protein C7412_14210 [Paraburkholderia silvatlantica]
MTYEEIRNEARELWLQFFRDAWRECQYEAEFAEFIGTHELKSEKKVVDKLQPWLHILDDSIQWLANLWAILDRRAYGQQEVSSQLKCAWVLLGASCAHAVAVRRLVLSGLDGPARAAARALDEHLSACIAMLHDDELAAGFQATESPDEFWYRNLNTKALKKHLNAVESNCGLDPSISVDMREWRHGELRTFSQTVHPSYLAAALTMKTFAADAPETVANAILGSASAASERTLDFACKTIWYFSRFGFFLIYNGYGGRSAVLQLDKEDEMHQMVVVGRDVLSVLNKKYWEYKIYPEQNGLGDNG